MARLRTPSAIKAEARRLRPRREALIAAHPNLDPDPSLPHDERCGIIFRASLEAAGFERKGRRVPSNSKEAMLAAAIYELMLDQDIFSLVSDGPSVHHPPDGR